MDNPLASSLPRSDANFVPDSRFAGSKPKRDEATFQDTNGPGAQNASGIDARARAQPVGGVESKQRQIEPMRSARALAKYAAVGVCESGRIGRAATTDGDSTRVELLVDKPASERVPGFSRTDQS